MSTATVCVSQPGRRDARSGRDGRRGEGREEGERREGEGVRRGGGIAGLCMTTLCL